MIPKIDVYYVSRTVRVISRADVGQKRLVAEKRHDHRIGCRSSYAMEVLFRCCLPSSLAWRLHYHLPLLLEQDRRNGILSLRQRAKAIGGRMECG